MLQLGPATNESGGPNNDTFPDRFCPQFPFFQDTIEVANANISG